MLVGVAVKLVSNDPTASVEAHFALEQRYELGVPVAVVFAIQLINAFIRNRHHYACPGALRNHPAHAGVLVARFLLLCTHVGICSVPLQPLLLLSVQALLALLHCALQHMQEHRLPITSTAKPSTARVPDALHVIRLKAFRQRNLSAINSRSAASGGAGSSAAGSGGGCATLASAGLPAAALDDARYSRRTASLDSLDRGESGCTTLAKSGLPAAAHDDARYSSRTVSLESLDPEQGHGPSGDLRC